MNPVKKLHHFGQSPWMDYIHRRILEDGTLAEQIERDGISGVTSNPSIFQKAIAGGGSYEEQLGELVTERPRAPVAALYEKLAIADIRRTADLLRSVWEASDGEDGYVSLEVSPYRAYDTEGTVAEARHLWNAVDRSNLMIKVPATAEGIPAIERLIAEGINVNITLMFSMADYEAVAEAYLRGLEAIDDPELLPRVASVASFFVSRVDAKIDPRLEQIGSETARGLRGKIAIANAKRAYRRFEEVFGGERFAALREKGARVQRVLWGSTSTKDPAYPDTLYVDELIGPHTINTMPPGTIDAFRDHGEPAETVTRDVEAADEQVAALAELGIDLDAVTDALKREGVSKFADAFDELLAAVEAERRRMLAEDACGGQSLFVGHAIGAVSRRLESWQDSGFGDRLRAHDPELWGQGSKEVLDRLGWLRLPRTMAAQLGEFESLAEEVRNDGIERVLVLGMGGSSLAPEVFARTFGRRDGWPELAVLDSTHPDAVAGMSQQIDPLRTLFVVSSKSGTTVETLSLFRHFWELTAAASDEPGRQFIAVTDPDTPLAELAGERGFRRLVTAPPEVGGRYSALSPFGLVPAALAGYDVTALLDGGLAMAEAAGHPEMINEPLRLGAALGELAVAGRDKLTFLTTPSLAAFPDWIEQLVAESTGKEGKGIVPVTHEPPGEPEEYGEDRLFVGLFVDGEEAASTEDLLDRLEAAGHPVVRLRLTEHADLGREMFRWEVAVAAAGAVLGVHPFDQPDVQRAKELARQALAEGGGKGEDGATGVGSRQRLEEQLAGWLDGITPGSYVAVQAYLAPSAALDRRLRELQATLRRRTGCPVSAAYGPRFLHSTGQLHKARPASGHFLQLVDKPSADRPVPGEDNSFGELIRSQALGDRGALEGRAGGLISVDLEGDPEEALATLGALLVASRDRAEVEV